MITKICTKCNKEKFISDFHRQKYGVMGRRSVCKICTLKQQKLKKMSDPNYKEIRRTYYKKNAVRIRTLQKISRDYDPEFRAKRRKYSRIRYWRKKYIGILWPVAKMMWRAFK